MRTYGQFCALAKALDVLGDRWTLLIVRELLFRAPCRYTDLKNGLPGIAPNLLVQRLRELEQNGLVVKRTPAPPVATDVFELTPRGKELECILIQLGRWGAPLLEKRRKKQAFQISWLALPLRNILSDHAPTQPPSTIEVRCGEQAIRIEAAGGEVHMSVGCAEKPDLRLTGEGSVLVHLLGGRISLSEARAEGLKIQGSVDALRRIQPKAFGTDIAV
jgi:DNA-binding HxlR family transcriptional regulator